MRATLTAAYLAIALFVLTGCGGGNVKSVDKTITHKGGIFNVAQVSHIGAKVEARTAGGEWQDVSALSGKELDAWMKGKSNVEAQSALIFDDFRLPLESKTVSKSGDLKDMQDYARKRINDVNDFMKSNNKQLDARKW